VERINAKRIVEGVSWFSFRPAPSLLVRQAERADKGKVKKEKRNLKAIREALKKPGYRRAFEVGNVSRFISAVKRYAKKT